MGKKTSTTKTAAPARRIATIKPAAEKAAVPQPAVIETNGTHPIAAAKTPKPAVKRSKKPAFSQEDLALRAYFIAERRQAAGSPGDAHQDWIEAERQLASETTKPARAKAKKS